MFVLFSALAGGCSLAAYAAWQSLKDSNSELEDAAGLITFVLAFVATGGFIMAALANL